MFLFEDLCKYNRWDVESPLGRVLEVRIGIACSRACAPLWFYTTKDHKYFKKHNN